MTYSFEFRHQAIIEFSEAYIWYEERQEGLGDRFERSVWAKINQICKNPLHYKIIYNKQHQALVDTFPFVVIYLVDYEKAMIVVTSIFHTSRNPK